MTYGSLDIELVKYHGLGNDFLILLEEGQASPAFDGVTTRRPAV